MTTMINHSEFRKKLYACSQFIWLLKMVSPQTTPSEAPITFKEKIDFSEIQKITLKHEYKRRILKSKRGPLIFSTTKGHIESCCKWTSRDHHSECFRGIAGFTNVSHRILWADTDTIMTTGWSWRLRTILSAFISAWRVGLPKQAYGYT